VQIYIPMGTPVSIELCLLDMQENHRRFCISTSIREVKLTALHCALPFPNITRAHVIVSTHQWANLAFDLADLVSETFKGSSFQSLSSISVSGTVKVRKIMTLKTLPVETGGLITTPFQSEAAIPATLDFPSTICSTTYVVNMLRYGVESLANNVEVEHSKTSKLAFGRSVKSTPIAEERKSDRNTVKKY
jgi:hypothetical protein